MEKSKKKRLFFLDLIRAVALVMVIFFHFNILFEHPILGEYINGLIANIGVSLFIIISGASLMYRYKDEKIRPGDFLKKRFQNIYPVFWISWIIVLLYLVIVNGQMTNIGNIPIDPNPFKILLTIIGMDYYSEAFGVCGTFALTGEWFIGFIILLYCIFPLLKKLLEKYEIQTIVVVIALFVATLLLWNRPWGNALITMRLPEFVFGMIFIRHFDTIKKYLNWKLILPIVAVLIILATARINNYVSNNISTAILGVLSFMALAYIGNVAGNNKFIVTPISKLAKISYPMFLFHHFVIYQVFAVVTFSVGEKSYIQKAGVFVLILVMTWLLSILAMRLYDFLSNLAILIRKVISVKYSG